MRSIGLGGHYMGSLVLRCAIGIQEFARNIDDSIAAPRHEQARAFGNRGNHDGFEIFLMRIADEFLDVLAAKATDMRSWLSEIASSVPSRPSYFLGTISKSMDKPSHSSPMERKRRQHRSRCSA